jgi:hypothetical protein
MIGAQRRGYADDDEDKRIRKGPDPQTIHQIHGGRAAKLLLESMFILRFDFMIQPATIRHGCYLSYRQRQILLYSGTSYMLLTYVWWEVSRQQSQLRRTTVMA